MSASNVKNLTLESLDDGIPALTPPMSAFFKENCMICFQDQGHDSGVSLRVVYRDSNEAARFHWSGKVTEDMLRAYKDLVQATSFAACAIALLLVREFTEFTAVEQAIRGTTVDYHLGRQSSTDDLIFNHTSRLEVSGILKENENNTVASRVGEKLKRLKSKGDLPALIVVVEFGEPWSNMVEV